MLRQVARGGGRPEGLHSLALVNRALCRELLDRGHDLGLLVGPEAGVLDAGPACPPTRGCRRGSAAARKEGRPRCTCGTGGRRGSTRPPAARWVFMQPWEFGSLPRAWLPVLRRVDEVWAYSRSVRECYLDAGVQPRAGPRRSPGRRSGGLSTREWHLSPAAGAAASGSCSSAGRSSARGSTCCWRLMRGHFGRPTASAW